MFVEIAVVVLVLLPLFYWFGVKDYSLIADVPINGPKPWPFVGNIPDVARYGGMHKMLWEHFKRYGRVHKLCIGRRPGIVVTDPEMVRQITVKEFHKFRNRPEFMKVNPPLSHGVGFARDENWKRIRTLLTPAFSSAKLKQVVPIVENTLDVLMKKLEKFAASGENVNVSKHFALFTLDFIMRSAYGYDTNMQNEPDQVFFNSAVNAISIPVWKRAFTMFPFSSFLVEFFNIQIIKDAEYFMSIARTMIASRQQHGSSGRRDLLQLMLEAHDKEVDGVPKLSDEELAAQSMVMLIAGFETTGITLTTTGYVLATNPNVQDKLLEELDKARANRGDMSLYELSHHIEYLDQVISEVLRLYTPGFNLIRVCREETVIKGVRFPKGVDVNIPNYVLHRDPEVWERPDEFYPEHFSAEANEKRSPYSYMPFGYGPRQCIGMRFALNTVKLTLLTVLEKYKFECTSKTVPLEHLTSVLMLPKNDVILKIVRR